MKSKSSESTAGCCKDKKYKIYLQINEYDEKTRLSRKLQDIFDWTFEQADQIMETSIRKGKCFASQVGHDEMLELTETLVKNNISFQTELLNGK